MLQRHFVEAVSRPHNLLNTLDRGVLSTDNRYRQLPPWQMYVSSGPPIRKREPLIPTDRANNNFGFQVPPFEQRRPRLIAFD